MNVSLGAVAGGAIGGGLGYFLGGRNTVSNEELNNAKAKITELEQKLTALSNAENTISSLKTELDNEKKKVTQKEQEITNLKNTVTEKEKVIDSLKAGDEAKAKLTDQVNTLTNEKADLTTQVTNLQNEINALKNDDALATIKEILGAGNVNNKEKLKRTLKLGQILDQSLANKGLRTDDKFFGIEFYHNWKGWHNLQPLLEEDYASLGTSNNHHIKDLMNVGIGMSSYAQTGAIEIFRMLLRPYKYKSDTDTQKRAYKNLCGFINFAVKLVNAVRDSKVVD